MVNVSKLQGRAMNQNSWFGLLLAFSAGLLFVASPSSHAAEKESKFHLVYLVSTDKLEVGNKVFVEPLFFTNGKRLVFAYNYCRQYFGKKYKLKDDFVYSPKEEKLASGQIADDLTPIHRYCEGQDVTFNVKGYVVRDSAGVRLGLDAVGFAYNQPYERLLYQQLLSLPRGAATIRAVDGAALITSETAVTGGQQYFFLMASNPALLDRIAPARTVSKEKAARFRQRVRRYTQARTTGNVRPSGMDICEIKSITTPPGQRPFMPPRKGPYRLSRAQILASLFGDLDDDNLTDLVVSIFEEYPRKKAAVDAETTEIRFFYGNGNERCLVWDQGVAYKLDPTSLPLGLIKVGNCRYLISSFDRTIKTLDLINLSDKAQGCKNLIVYKHWGLFDAG